MAKSPDNPKKSLLSEQSAILKRIHSNLITILGYELWNPLSTIQVCLETLANEPLISEELRQIIINTGLKDIQRLGELVEDCIKITGCESEPIDYYDNCLELQTSLQNILQATLLRIVELNPINILPYLVNPKYQLSEPNFLSNNQQADTFKHIRNNLMAIVGHELRTPMCTIQVCLESLAIEPDMSLEYRKKMLQIAQEDTERLNRLIRDFFTLSRLEHGQIYHRLEHLQLQQALDLALISLRTHKSSPSLPKIVLEIPATLPQIKADGDRLVEALIQLLDNACKFTDSNGEIRIKAKTINNGMGTNYSSMVEVIVSDTGRGIAPDNLEAVFNCFYQEENHLRRTVNGTGIGLAICRQTIHTLGGKIWATSAGKKKGSSIHFTIPVESGVLSSQGVAE